MFRCFHIVNDSSVFYTWLKSFILKESFIWRPYSFWTIISQLYFFLIRVLQNLVWLTKTLSRVSHYHLYWLLIPPYPSILFHHHFHPNSPSLNTAQSSLGYCGFIIVKCILTWVSHVILSYWPLLIHLSKLHPLMWSDYVCLAWHLKNLKLEKVYYALSIVWVCYPVNVCRQSTPLVLHNWWASLLCACWSISKHHAVCMLDITVF